VSFPAGLFTIVVTGEHILSLDGQQLNGSVIFSAAGPVDDPAVNALLEGSAVGPVINGVMTPLTLPCTDAVSPGFVYTITVRLQTPDPDPPPVTGVAIPHTLGATVDLSALI
jgi:hypothetical protein